MPKDELESIFEDVPEVIEEAPAPVTKPEEIPVEKASPIIKAEITQVATKDMAIFDSIVDLVASVPGVTAGEVGMKVNRYPIDRIKFTTAKRELISILTSKVIATKTHYLPGIGSLLCFGGACCEDNGMPKVRYVFPIIQYETDAKGKPISTKVEVKALTIGSDVYEDIMMVTDNFGDVSKVDLIVSCKDETYQKISLQPAGEARWKKQPAIAEGVANEMRNHGKYLLSAVARSVTPAQYNELMGKDRGVASVTEADFDSAFGLGT